jgi:sulfate permease, SulP family
LFGADRRPLYLWNAKNAVHATFAKISRIRDLSPRRMSCIPGTRRFSDLARHQDNQRIPGVLAFRVESGILYFNVEHIFRIVLDRIEAEGEALRLIVCDLSTSPTLDLAGARMLLDLHTELAKRGMVLRLVEARASVRDLLRIEGAEDRVGRIDRFATVGDVIEHFQKEGAQI